MVLNLDGLEVDHIQRPKHDYETTVVFGRWNDAPVVLKTFAFHPLILRWLLGWLCRREARLLITLAAAPSPWGEQDLQPGIPHPWLPEGARHWGRWGVLMPRMAGIPLGEIPPGTLPPVFLQRLEAAVEALHRQKVVHLDLKNGGNILVTEQGYPVLLDFAGCLSFRGWPLVGGLMTRLFGWVDRAAVVKWKRDHTPEAVLPEELRLLERRERWRRWWPFPIRNIYRRGKVRTAPPEAPSAGDPDVDKTRTP